LYSTGWFRAYYSILGYFGVVIFSQLCLRWRFVSDGYSFFLVILIFTIPVWY